MNDSRSVAPPRDEASARLQDAFADIAVEERDEPPTTWTAEATFRAIVDRRYSRRRLMRGGLQAAVAGLFASVVPIGCALPSPRQVGGRLTSPPAALGFKPIPIYDGDEIVVAPGYTARPFLVTGTPIAGAGVGDPKAAGVGAYEACSGADMEQRIGAHHDGMHYFPFPDDPNNHGLLCVNHEYIDGAKMMPEKVWVGSGVRPADQVRKGVASHGVSITEIRRKPGGEWQVVPGRYNRRITAETAMEIRGAVRGSPLVVTKYSPDGTRARGTFNNCANGYTPWNTYLTCEENWAGYFASSLPEPEPPGGRGAAAGAESGARTGGGGPGRGGPGRGAAGAAGSARGVAGRGAPPAEGSDTDPDAEPEPAPGPPVRRELRRYGVGPRSVRYGWDMADGEPTASPDNPDPYRRFNVAITGASAREDYRNESNGHGWIVEIDPWDPASTPIKHTGLGRFAHEGCVFSPPKPNEPLVFYSGDDAGNQYIYKFVTGRPYVEGASDGRLLDEGTLYVARFEPDGSGTWLPLAYDDPQFRAAVDRAIASPRSVWPAGQYDDFDGFADQGDVLVNTRLAADVMGATPMDRPEWGAVHPHTGDVYFSLTNNSRRGRRDTSATSPVPAPVDAANPRPANEFGHIIRWREGGGRAAATRFEWDIFVLSGTTTNSQDHDGFVLSPDAIHGSPDGLWIDDRGVLWIETDLSPGDLQAQVKRLGNNALLAADPSTGEIRRFFVGPRGQEISGFASTPDGRTLFINVQHPGEFSERSPLLASTYPDGPGGRGRSCTIVITKDDGGVIGT
jgi:uncharacterized protein